MFNIFKNFFGSPLAQFGSIVLDINALEPEIAALGNEDLKRESEELRSRATGGALPEELLPRAFALVREASKRTLGQRQFDVQLMGGIALHRGAVAEMATGEGKTLVAVAPAYLNALAGKGMHVVTVNEYLARRDAVWMGQIYYALGIKVACLVPNAAYLYDPTYVARTDANPSLLRKDEEQTGAEKIPRGSAPAPSATEGSDPRESALLDKERDTTGAFLVQQEFLRPISRREAYQADITYGTNHEFGFDYLRDNLAYRVEDQVQNGHHCAIIDEVDSILIDEARTPLIISAPDAQSSDFYKVFARVVRNLEPDADYAVDEKLRSVAITDAGIAKAEQMVGVRNIYAPENLRLVHYLEESLRAKALYRRDKDYVVKNNEIIIVDEFTGRLLHGRRYNGGLHQAIEAKEGVLVKEESRTYAKISIQNYFRMYERVAGMTGTAQTSAEEFYKVYKLEVTTIPTNRPLMRENFADAIYKNLHAKMEAVTRDVGARHAKGQPILIGTASIEKNELISTYLERAGIPHEVLNAKNNEREGAIIAQAGRLKAVTVATNIAGRGVDIILGGNPPDAEEAEKVRALGGLHVIGTDRNEARRIDNQLRGRAGRQGDPGSSQFFLSLEDDLLRIFGGDRIKNLMERFNLPDDQPIEMGMVSKAVAQAQAKVEGANFDMRKHLLEYDDVLNKQRMSVYAKRRKILESLNKEELAKIIFDAVSSYAKVLEEQIASRESAPADPDAAKEPEKPEDELKRIFEEAGIATKDAPFPEDPSPEHIDAFLETRSKEISGDALAVQKVLGILDLLWMSNLEDLEALQESVGLRAYGHKEPLVEFRQESHRLFKNFWNNFNAWIFTNLFRLARTDAEQGANKRGSISVNQHAHQHESAYEKKVGRNDLCPCGSGKKYKKCHGK